MPTGPLSLLVVAAGGALGSVLRYLVAVAAVEGFGLLYPWATIAVNVLGSAAIGVAAGLGVSGEWRLFLVTGVLGGFTTFSAFSLDTGLLFEQRSGIDAALYVGATIALGLLAFGLGYGLVRRG